MQGRTNNATSRRTLLNTMLRSRPRARRLLQAGLLLCLVAPAIKASADESPLSAQNKRIYSMITAMILRSAEKVPAESYDFKPTPEVRSAGQIFGHIADAQYIFCSRYLGEANPTPKVEESKHAKADLIAALKEAFAYCNKAYDGATDQSGLQTVKLFGSDTPRLTVLSINEIHTIEHYGNLVTYMRLLKIVPPTSEPGALPTKN